MITSKSIGILLLLVLSQGVAQIPIVDVGAEISIEQTSKTGIIGSWILIDQAQREESKDRDSFTLFHRPEGVYTLFVDPPEGAAAAIEIYKNGSLLSSVPRSQAAFNLAEGDVFRILIRYTFIRIGTVAVHTDPPDISFTLTGPNDLEYEGKTPETLYDTPEGQYTAYFHPPDGCIVPPPKSLRLERDRRVTFSVTLSCEAADKMRERQNPELQKFVTVRIDGKDTTLRDVPQDSWFALPIHTIVQRNISSGYRDEQGNPTGLYGPENLVTVAELAKMAHKIGGIRSTENLPHAGATPEKPSLKVTYPARSDQTYRTSQSALELSGTAPLNADAITVDTYRLRKFTEGDATWSYNISEDLGNLRKGENIYDIVALDAFGGTIATTSITILLEDGPEGLVTEYSVEDEDSLIPRNPKAHNSWFSSYIASAESRGWTIFTDATIDPLMPATRGEVIVTLLQALDIPLTWQKGDRFNDVNPRTLYAAAIETAADEELVTGFTDGEGNPTGLFGPDDPVNRAEIAAIFSRALEKYKGG